MERTYILTTEMQGMAWVRMFLWELVAIAGGFLGYGLLTRSKITFTFDEAMVALLTAAFTAAAGFAEAPSDLVVTDLCIRQGKHNVIGMNDLKKVKECRRFGVRGLLLIHRKRNWWRDNSVFIPAALPDYEEIKQQVTVWCDEQVIG